MIIIKKSAALERMRESNWIAAMVRDKVATEICPGVTTGRLADYADELIEKEDAKAAFRGYRGFPGHICVSVNEEVVHGIPGDRRILIGDIVSIDIGVLKNGYYGDTATTVMVGVTDPDIIKLVKTTERALNDALSRAVAGARLSDVSHSVETTAKESGYTVVRDFVGHGIGRKLHEDPQIPNFGRPGKGPRLKKGMTLSIEPMVNMGVETVDVLDDNWTVVTRDRQLSAHFEHTIAVRNGKPEILTLGTTK